MRITRVYTRRGDQGRTTIVGGRVVAKDDARMAALGSVDELNASLGLALAAGGSEKEKKMLRQIQNVLFNIGGDLATPAAHRRDGQPRVEEEDVNRLEDWIDMLNDDLEPLTEFVLPGGSPLGAQLHLARTVARRAERRLCALMAQDDEVRSQCLKYLNRLSDFLFVLARWTNRDQAEPLWEHC
jgi:cob(I)alamin adenosyltransferase